MRSAIIAFGCFAVLMGAGWFMYGVDQDNQRQTAATGRAERTRSVIPMTPVPLADLAGPSLIGDPAARDPDGYPTAYVDMAVLRSLLWHERYAQLDRQFNKWISQARKSHTFEYWLRDAVASFSTAEPWVGERLDAWVAQIPESLAARLARADHLLEVGYTARGSDFVANTHKDNFAAMHRALSAAREDIDHVITKAPDLPLTYTFGISAAMAEGAGSELARYAEQAMDACPKCFLVRVKYINALVPRWGGSFAAMNDLVQRSPPSLNPRFRHLPNYIVEEHAHQAVMAEDLPRALKIIDGALQKDHWVDLLSEKAAILARMKQWNSVLRTLDEIEKLRPRRVFGARAQALYHLDLHHDAAKQLIQHMRYDPTSWYARKYARNISYGLWKQAKALAEDGDAAAGVILLDLATQLTPTDGHIHRLRIALVNKSNPTDEFHRIQKRDYELAEQKRYAEILPLWNDYLARNPRDGRAYLERAGTHYHLRHHAEFMVDLQKSCELGIPEGCARLERYR